jgi:hypothetical protein
MDDIRKVVAVDSVEEFWGMYNNIVPPSQLPGKANYYMFRVSTESSTSWGRVSAVLTSRKPSCPHGRTRQTKTVESGPSSCPGKNSSQTSTKCGFTP